MGPVGTGDWGLGLGLDNMIVKMLVHILYKTPGFTVVVVVVVADEEPMI